MFLTQVGFPSSIFCGIISIATVVAHFFHAIVRGGGRRAAGEWRAIIRRYLASRFAGMGGNRIMIGCVTHAEGRRTSLTANWIFEHNQLGATEGPNDPGIAQFTDDRMGALVRELLQNSIDARAGDAPVVVDFEIVDAPIGLLAIDQLKEAIEASIDSDANDDTHRKQFRRGLKLLEAAQKSGTIQCLVVTDRNTTGASDRDGERDKWHNLTKSKGKSVQNSRGAGGSFGIGKHSAFVFTDLRTVFYSTAYKDSGRLERRFIGKSILVSHTRDGERYNATGYLGCDDKATPFANDDIPDISPVFLNETGTATIILGFRKRGRWQEEAIETVVTHFFHAITQGNLRVNIGDTTIDSNSIDAMLDGVDENVKALTLVSRMSPLETTRIAGIGKVNLRLKVDRERISGNRTIALVRDSGMVITRTLGNMRRTRSQQMLSFGGRWYAFTAIVECIADGERSLLREAEGPRHDVISPDNADAEEQREVRASLRKLGDWVMDTLSKYAKPPPPKDSDYATEMAGLLPLADTGGGHAYDVGRAKLEITAPMQSEVAPRSLATPGRRPPRARNNNREVTEGAAKRKNRRARRSRRATTRKPPQISLSDLRRLPPTLGQWPHHTVRFAFDMPERNIKRLRLFAIGEDGKSDSIHIERAYIDGRRIKVENGEIADIDVARRAGDRLSIEIKAISVIDNKRVEIGVE